MTSGITSSLPSVTDSVKIEPSSWDADVITRNYGQLHRLVRERFASVGGRTGYCGRCAYASSLLTCRK